jgi:hypothetical protein
MVRTLAAIVLGLGVVGCKPPAGAIASTTAAASVAAASAAGPGSGDAQPAAAPAPSAPATMSEVCRRCLDDAAQQARGEDGGSIDASKAVLYRGPNSCELAVPLKGRDADDGLQYGGDCPCECADSFVTKAAEERG